MSDIEIPTTFNQPPNSNSSPVSFGNNTTNGIPRKGAPSLPSSIKAIPLLEMMIRTNEFLASSPPEYRLVRADRCQELEYWLKSTKNDVSYVYLDSSVCDTTRRKYNVPTELMLS